jgi:hypothetical protein
MLTSHQQPKQLELFPIAVRLETHGSMGAAVQALMDVCCAKERRGYRPSL